MPRAHYRAAPSTAHRLGAQRRRYPGALFPELGIVPGRTGGSARGVGPISPTAARSRLVLWSEPTPGATDMIAALQRAGLAVVIVTNSDGHGEENLRRSGFAGVPVIDSDRGRRRPSPTSRIFEAALAAPRELAALG